MAKPTKPTVPAAPLRSNPSTFSAQAETFLAFISPFATYMDESSDFVDGRADAALAAALGGDLPALTGNAGKVLRVNAGETAGEFFTLGTASLMADSADADLAVDPDAAARRDIVAAHVAAHVAAAIAALPEVVINTTTVTTAVANVEVLFDPAPYRFIRVEIVSLVPVSDAVGLQLRTAGSDDAFDIGAADYSFTGYGRADNGYKAGDNASASAIDLTPGPDLSNVAGDSFSATLIIYDPNGTGKTFIKGSSVHRTDVADLCTMELSGERLENATVNGIQLFCSSGNIDECTITVIGVK